VAGTSSGTTLETTNVGSSQTEERVVAARSQGHRHADGLSKAQINVVRTMVYITVCFIVCWMPIYFYILFARFKVTVTKWPDSPVNKLRPVAASCMNPGIFYVCQSINQSV